MGTCMHLSLAKQIQNSLNKSLQSLSQASSFCGSMQIPSLRVLCLRFVVVFLCFPRKFIGPTL